MTELKRSLGLFKITLMGVGVILGAGIYALIGKVALISGNAMWLSFILAALVAALTGLSYAELSSFIPKAGGEYFYARRAFGSFYAFLLSWLLIIGLAIASGAVALGFAGYFSALFHTDILWTAVFLVLITTGALLYGTEQAAWIAVFCTILEVFGVLMVIAVGIPEIGSVNYWEMANGVSGLISAAALIFFAYIGFDEVVQLSEETRHPEKNIPRAVLLSIGITAVLYVLVALSCVSLLGWEQLGRSSAPLADVVSQSLGSWAFLLLSVIALFSTANTVLLIIMSASRILYGMGGGGSMPAVFSRVHHSWKTPHIATLFIAIISIVMIILLQKIEIVANLTNFAFFTTFIFINASVIVLRFREPDRHRPFRIPLAIGRVPLVPVAGVIATGIMILNVGWEAWILGLLIIVLGVLLYPMTRHKKDDAALQ